MTSSQVFKIKYGFTIPHKEVMKWLFKLPCNRVEGGLELPLLCVAGTAWPAPPWWPGAPQSTYAVPCRCVWLSVGWRRSHHHLAVHPDPLGSRSPGYWSTHTHTLMVNSQYKQQSIIINHSNNIIQNKHIQRHLERSLSSSWKKLHCI